MVNKFIEELSFPGMANGSLYLHLYVLFPRHRKEAIVSTSHDTRQSICGYKTCIAWISEQYHPDIARKVDTANSRGLLVNASQGSVCDPLTTAVNYLHLHLVLPSIAEAWTNPESGVRHLL
jgi:hypothetical protein